MHAGAEGSDRQHVRSGTERFLGENRGDPLRFAHAVVDAGADLVVGSGPHVLRGMEWYRGRLIAYSLGNFAGYKVSRSAGRSRRAESCASRCGATASSRPAELVPTHLVGPGLPAIDPAEAAHGVVRTLSREDFGARGVKISPDGILSR